MSPSAQEFPVSRFRWLMFAVLTAMYVLAYFYRVSAAVMAKDLGSSFQLDAQQLGTLAAVLFYAFAITQLPLGPLLDRVGPRRIIFCMTLLTAGGAWLFSGAETYAGALLGRILIGSGTACVLMGSFKVYTAWFPPSRFATLSGIQIAFGNVGNLLATAPLAWLLGIVGWRPTFAWLALVTAAMAVLIWCLVRDMPAGVSPPVQSAPFWQGWRQVFVARQFWQLALLAFFWYGGYMAVQGLWGGPYLMTILGLDREQTGHLLLFTALGFIVGCPLAGRLSDKIWRSRKKVVLLGQSLLLAGLSFFLGGLECLPSRLLPLVFFVIGLGVSTGPVLYAQIKESFPRHLAATAMTAVNFFVVMGAAVVQQAMGLVVKSSVANAAGASAFHLAFALPVVGLAVTLLIYCFSRETFAR